MLLPSVDGAFSASESFHDTSPEFSSVAATDDDEDYYLEADDDLSLAMINRSQIPTPSEIEARIANSEDPLGEIERISKSSQSTPIRVLKKTHRLILNTRTRPCEVYRKVLQAKIKLILDHLEKCSYYDYYEYQEKLVGLVEKYIGIACRFPLLFEAMLDLVEKMDSLSPVVVETLLGARHFNDFPIRTQRQLLANCSDLFADHLHRSIVSDYLEGLKVCLSGNVTDCGWHHFIGPRKFGRLCERVGYDSYLFVNTLYFTLSSNLIESFGGLVGCVLDELIGFVIANFPEMPSTSDFDLGFKICGIGDQFGSSAQTQLIMAIVEHYDSAAERLNQIRPDQIPLNEFAGLVALSSPFRLNSLAFELINAVWFPDDNNNNELDQSSMVEFVELRIEFLNLALISSSAVMDFSKCRRLEAHAVRTMRSSLLEAIASTRNSFSSHRERKSIDEPTIVGLLNQYEVFGLLWQHLLMFALRMLWVKSTNFSVPYSLLRPLNLCSCLRTDSLWLRMLAFSICKRSASEIVGLSAEHDHKTGRLMLPSPVARGATVGFANELRRLDNQVVFMAIQTIFATPMIVRNDEERRTSPPGRYLVGAYEVLSVLMDNQDEDRIAPKAFTPYIERLRPVGTESDLKTRIAYERLNWKFAAYARPSGGDVS